MPEERDVGKRKDQTKAVDPHALYAGDAQPADAGGGRTGKDLKVKQRHGKHKQKQP